MRGAVFAAPLLAFIALSAPAQVPSTPVGFSRGTRSWALELGAAVPTSTNGFDQAVRPGPAVMAQYLRYPKDWLAWGAELGLFQFGKQTLPTPPGVSASGKASAETLLLIGRVNWFEEGSWSPYFLGGFGVHAFKLSISNNSSTYDPYAALHLPNGLKNGLALSGGAGVEGFLFQGVSLALEARYHQFRKGSSSRATAESINALLALRFWF